MTRRRPGVVGGLAGVVALVACGSSKPPEAPAPVVSSRVLTRVPVEEHDDDVQVVSNGNGHVEPAVVEAALAPRRDQLTACYRQRVGRRTWLGGHLVLRWTIAADGTIVQVLLAQNDLGAWPVEQCVLALAREIQFGTPIGGLAEVALPLTLSAKGTTGLWDDAQSAKAVGKQLAKLDACARGKPVLPEAVEITIYAGPRGKVLSVGFGSEVSVIEDDWAACAEKAVLAWHLPDPKGQVTKLAVRYRPR